MKTEQPKTKVTGSDAEAALCGFVHDLEAQMPETDGEILAMFKAIDPATLSQPNVRKFEKFLDSELDGQRKPQVMGKIGDFVKKISTKLSPNQTARVAPVAARKLKIITPEIRQKMDEAKKKTPGKKGQQ